MTGREEYPWLFVYMSGFTSPGTVGLYDFSAPGHKRWSIYRTTVLNGLNPDEFEVRQVSCFNSSFLVAIHDLVEQVWYNSKDGTRIPMFIVRHRSTNFDGTAPVLQYGKKQLFATPACSALLKSKLRLRRI